MIVIYEESGRWFWAEPSPGGTITGPKEGFETYDEAVQDVADFNEPG